MRNFNIVFKRTALSVLLASMFIFILSPVIAADSTSISVNGTSIYTSGGGYNSSHGIAGVTFDVPTMTLTLSDAAISSIVADDDLTVNLVGTNTITSTGAGGKAISVQGNAVIKGDNGADLTINSQDIAIEIGSGKRLTIGDAGSLNDVITVSILSGTNLNTDDTFIVGDNVYNPSLGGTGNLKISVGGVLEIDETADPPVTTASGTGWSIEPGYMNIYQMNIDSGASIDYVTSSGNGSISLNPSGGNVTIGEDSGYSLYMSGVVNILTERSATLGNIALSGGIYTQGGVSVDDRDVTVGTAEVRSAQGIWASQISVGSGNLSVYTTADGLQYYDATPDPGQGLAVESSAGKTLSVLSDNSTVNTNTVRVSGGGTINFTYNTSLGTFTPEASHWPWTDMTGTEEENPEPVTVTCAEGTDAINKYRMTSSEGNFLLESTAGTLYKLGWNIPDADDSIVTNGTVRVIAANGTKDNSGGYVDYSIEAGSTVTIELLPDYGYQYVSGGLNGNQTVPDEGKGSYTFVMPANHLHLSAIFEKSDDIININSNSVTNATINLPLGDINGNAQLTVQDASGVDKSVFEKAANGSTVGSYLDMSLSEVIFKGSRDETWVTNITDLNSAMTVNLSLDDNLQDHTDYTVLRNHNGVVSEISSTYNADTDILSFASDKYSSYAIAYNDNNPDTSGGILKYQIIGLICIIGLGGTFLYSRKKAICSKRTS